MQRLKILVIPAYKLFPIDSGGAHGQLSFLDQQQEMHDIDILITPENLEEQDIAVFKNKFSKLTILKELFKKDSRLSKVKNFFRKEYRKKSGKDAAYAFRKTKYINLLVFNTPDIIGVINNITSKKKYDIVQIEHTKNISLIEAVKGAAKKIFIHHEIYFTRVLQDMRSLSYNSVYSQYISNAVQALEVYWLKKYDGIITFNEEDKKLLTDLGLTTAQQVAKPFALFNNELELIYDASLTPKLAFIGGESHYPNKEGIIWFIEKCFPFILEKFPDTLLEITGNWSREFQEKFRSTHIHFLGFIKNLDTVFKSAIMIVPINIGSGIKIKTITSLAKGVPVVATTHGADAIPGLIEGTNIFIADEPLQFAERILRLLENEPLRNIISKNAFKLSQTLFENNDIAAHRNEFYEAVLKI